jgi:predicted TIM-barrel fold metal-dependent hydrolase
VDAAVAEVERIASLGLCAAMLPVVAPTPWNAPAWEPLWSAIEAARLPVVMHQGTGHDMIWDRGRGATIANLIATQSLAPRVATMLATSGVLAGHEALHVVFVEFNGGWLAWTMDTADYYSRAFAGLTTATQGSAKLGRHTGAPRPVLHPELPEPPSAYLRRQVHATFQDDRVALANVGVTGSACLLWGSDYPHDEGTHPHTRAVVDRLGAPLDDATAAAVFRDNAARLFSFDPAVLASPA